MTDTDPQDELAELLASLMDESLTDGQHARLSEILRSDPAARAWYREIMHVHGMFHWRWQGDQEAEAPSAAARKNSPSIRIPRSTLHSLYRSTAEIVFHPIMLVLLLTMVSAGVLVYSFSTQPAAEPQNLVKASPESTPAIQESVVNEPVRLPAIVTRTTNARWEDKFASSGGRSLAKGQRLKLISGFAEIAFESRATALVEGPAEFEIAGHNACALSAGKLVAYVPAAAHGFEVQTPTLRIVDRGTEFGVIVKANDPSPPAPSLQPPASSSTEVHVITGKVTVAPLPGPDASQLQVAQAPVELKAGEAVRSSAESPELKVTPAEAGKFVRQIPHSAPMNGLLGHWPLDGSFRAAVGTDGKHFISRFFTPAVDRSGKADGAVFFTGTAAMAVAGGGGLDGLNEGTISLFVKWQGQQPKPGIPGAVFGRQMPHAGWLDAILALTGTDPATAVLYWKARGESWPLQGHTPVGDEKWRHVAVTFGPTGQELYLDGTAEAHTNNVIPGGLHRAAVGAEAALTIGGITFDAASYARCAIDDVKIFNRQLTAEEIKALATVPAEAPSTSVPAGKGPDASGTLAPSRARQ